MSYALDVTPDALNGLATLPAGVQEEVLDALDVVAANPDLLVVRPPLVPDALYDFVTLAGGMRYYVFIVVEPDRLNQVIRVKKVAAVVRPP